MRRDGISQLVFYLSPVSLREQIFYQATQTSRNMDRKQSHCFPPNTLQQTCQKFSTVEATFRYDVNAIRTNNTPERVLFDKTIVGWVTINLTWKLE